jgi:uncharacterized phiE125 gp8 family phage protein
MSLRLITPPSGYPVTATEVKENSRWDGTDLDGIINTHIATATALVQKYAGRAIKPQTWELVLDAFSDSIMLPLGPVTSITSITYYDTDEVLQTLATDQYVLDNVADPAWIVRPTDVTYPGVADGVNNVIIRFLAGSLWAKVRSSINGREEVIGGVLQGNSYFEIAVRYRTDLEVAIRSFGANNARAEHSLSRGSVGNPSVDVIQASPKRRKVPKRYVRGDRAFGRLLKQMPDSVANELREQLNKTGRGSRPATQRRSVRTGAVQAGLSYTVTPKRLSLKVGLVGKAINRKLFYGWFVEWGRKAWRSRDVKRACSAERTRRSAEASAHTCRSPPASFIAGLCGQIYPAYRNIWDRALRNAARGGDD